MRIKPSVAPRGWNSWDCYGAAVTEDIVRTNARYMADNLKEYGYDYVVVDIQWYEPTAGSNDYHPFAEVCMDEYGRLLPAENRFPSAAGGAGFKPLADYVHSLGLKFGIHIMRGIPRQAVAANTPVLGCQARARDIAKTNSICGWNTDMYGVNTDVPGGREYYDSIFALYAEWGVDFIKCDDIARELPHEESELIALSEALRDCPREMVLSLSPGPALVDKAELYKQISNMWRITDDFWDDYKLLYAMFERAEKWSIHAGAGHYPDADMLPVAAVRQCYSAEEWTKFTEPEMEQMLLLWCIMRSPLMIGSELTKLDDWTYALLTNRALLQMHANSRHAHQLLRRENAAGQEYVIWEAVSAEDGSSYVCLFNLSDEPLELTVSLDELELDAGLTWENVLTGETEPVVSELKCTIAAHGGAGYRAGR